MVQIFKISNVFIIVILVFVLTSVDTVRVFGFDDASDKPVDQEKDDGIILLPVLSYMPETKIAAGALVSYFFRESGSDRHSRPSTLMPSVIFTQKKQFSSELSADLYWKNELYYLKGYISYKKFPDKFYGIGNNTKEENEENYTPLIYQLRLNFQKIMVFDSYLGLLYEIENTKMIQVEEDGLLDHGNIKGSEGGTTSGLGLSINRDTRNNVFYPSSGSQYQFSMKYFLKELGSNFIFSQYTFDIRKYYEPYNSHVFAIHSYIN